MVSTRGHPQEFPEPDLSPSKSTPSRVRKARSSAWAHTPSNLTVIWLCSSIPAVVWDAGYVFLRPFSMPGGALHWPLWAPYALYGKIDYIYGWKAFNEHNGFTAAQTFLNVIETSMYIYYLYILYAYGEESVAPGRGAPNPAIAGFLGQQRAVPGQKGVKALLIGYTAAVMTVSKTVLYCKFSWGCLLPGLCDLGLNEYYSGFENIGHNNLRDLFFLWIIPKLVFSMALHVVC